MRILFLFCFVFLLNELYDHLIFHHKVAWEPALNAIQVSLPPSFRVGIVENSDHIAFTKHQIVWIFTSIVVLRSGCAEATCRRCWSRCSFVETSFSSFTITFIIASFIIAPFIVASFIVTSFIIASFITTKRSRFGSNWRRTTATRSWRTTKRRWFGCWRRCWCWRGREIGCVRRCWFRRNIFVVFRCIGFVVVSSANLRLWRFHSHLFLFSQRFFQLLLLMLFPLFGTLCFASHVLLMFLFTFTLSFSQQSISLLFQRRFFAFL
mmetsp:Transcript_13364/g.23041  ORF Transcript_13364/g.23041 Transcript_13364/m.23041 type:complete len:265 (-) Transcript_13364:598-1392(-)